jgi:lipoprotein-anchoring transpeptidase ErfK/SrfK
MNRRFVAALAGLCGVVIGAASASAQQYPTSQYPGYPAANVSDNGQAGYGGGYSAAPDAAGEPVRRRYENNQANAQPYPPTSQGRGDAYSPPPRPDMAMTNASAGYPQDRGYPQGSAYPQGNGYPQGGVAPAREAAIQPGPQPMESRDPLPRPPETVGSIPSQSAGSPASDAAAGASDDQSGAEKQLPAKFQRTLVDFQTHEPVGTIIIDTGHTYLYLVMPRGKALRYGIGVGREGFTWAGEQRISRMAEWPDWHPPAEMIDRQPYLPRFMAGGPANPLGARAMYLGNTLYRIHGTNEPSTIGTYVSSGCVRLINADVEDLFQRVRVGTRVIVLSKNASLASVH